MNTIFGVINDTTQSQHLQEERKKLEKELQMLHGSIKVDEKKAVLKKLRDIKQALNREYISIRGI